MPISFAPDFSSRLEASEWMDDRSRADEHLDGALRDIRRVNWLLGAYRASDSALDPLLDRREELRIIDLGCGSGDYLCHLLRRGAHRNCTVQAVGIDANPATVGHARAHVDEQLPPTLQQQISIDTGDALGTRYGANEFDVAHAALFLHHLHGTDAPALLQEMDRISERGIVINDLHRHPVAYAGIWMLSRVLRMSPMVQHDGPMSVRRGFVRSDLKTIATEAGLSAPVIEWHWAFRWILSTCPRFDH